MTKLKEKDIVNKIVSSWEDYFPELNFRKTEYVFKNSRIDIFADFEVDRELFELKPSPYKLMAPVFFEVKWQSEMRDLIYELQKQIEFRDFYTNVAGNLAVICVISDKFTDKTMVKYMIDNNVHMYIVTVIDDDIDTLTLTEYQPMTELNLN